VIVALAAAVRDLVRETMPYTVAGARRPATAAGSGRPSR
jgi:hypothetical protein